jgi:LacI family transcriptional regulator, gluconate utilization system Gnt-I transcriptional repressor
MAIDRSISNPISSSNTPSPQADSQANPKKVTLADVAEAAGVSAITVSRVVNQPEKVSDELRQQVQVTIQQLGYVPNPNGSSSTSARSKVIGVAIPSLTNVVFTDVLRGISDVLGAAGYKVLLVDTHYSPIEEEQMIRTLLSQGPEAMILTGGDQTKAAENLLSLAKMPTVQMMELLTKPLDMNVGFSNWHAGYDVAKHLLDQGYAHIGFIGARMDPRAQQRLAGFKTALEESGKYRKNVIITTHEPSSIRAGGALFKSVMACSRGNADAVFCANDDLALGALFESQRMNIKVPNDLALCGFNDIEAAEFVNPSLTSVSVGRYEMGKKAAEMVVDRLSGKLMEKNVIDMGYEIKKRQSTTRAFPVK